MKIRIKKMILFSVYKHSHLCFLAISFLIQTNVCICTTYCEQTGTFSAFLPNHHSYLATKKEIDGIVVALVDHMIIGDIICDEHHQYDEYDNMANDIFDHNLSQYQHIEFKGEFSWPALADLEGKSSENKRQLDALAMDARWPGSVVYYEIQSEFPGYMVSAIHAAAWTWTHNSPVRFIQSSDAEDRLSIFPVDDRSCFSYLGRRGGVQAMGLNYKGYCTVGSIIHEMGHAIGWHHEHSRPDRDDYITILDDSVLLGSDNSYVLLTDDIAYYGMHDYDYGSVMHYPQTNSKGKIFDVIGDRFDEFRDRYPNDIPFGRPGQRLKMSTLDKTMSYSYFHECSTVFSINVNGANWVSYPWGGCNVQCNGPSYRQRFVACIWNGVCVSNSNCIQSSMPVTRQMCELEPEKLLVSFDESHLQNQGGVMQNVAFYDQFDWILWSGELPEVAGGCTDNIRYDGINTAGPGIDATGSVDGGFMLFPSFVREGDQAWYESPVLTTTNSERCQVSFAFFSTSRRSKLRVELAFCKNCSVSQELWLHQGYMPSWSKASVAVPEFPNENVKLRFVAQHVRKGNGNIGLDNIEFSKGCIRSNLDDLKEFLDVNAPMAHPYEELDLRCVYINNRPEPFYFLHPFVDFTKLMIFSSIAFLMCCASLWHMHVVRYRKRYRKEILKLKKAMYGNKDETLPNKEVEDAYLTLRKMRRKESIRRSSSLSFFTDAGSLKGRKVSGIECFHPNKRSSMCRGSRLESDFSFKMTGHGGKQNNEYSPRPKERPRLIYSDCHTFSNRENGDVLFFSNTPQTDKSGCFTVENTKASIPKHFSQTRPSHCDQKSSRQLTGQGFLPSVVSTPLRKMSQELYLPHVREISDFWQQKGCADQVKRVRQAVSFTNHHSANDHRGSEFTTSSISFFEVIAEEVAEEIKSDHEVISNPIPDIGGDNKQGSFFWYKVIFKWFSHKHDDGGNLKEGNSGKVPPLQMNSEI